jgi:hypothetical protein
MSVIESVSVIESEPTTNERLREIIDDLFFGKKYDDLFTSPRPFSSTELAAASDVLHGIAAAAGQESCRDDSWDSTVTFLCVLACQVEDAACHGELEDCL